MSWHPDYCAAHQQIGRGDAVLVMVSSELLAKLTAGWSPPMQIMVDPKPLPDGTWMMIARQLARHNATEPGDAAAELGLPMNYLVNKAVEELLDNLLPADEIRLTRPRRDQVLPELLLTDPADLMHNTTDGEGAP